MSLEIVVFLAMVALAVVVDARTGRGYGLGILSLLLLASTIVAVAVMIGLQREKQPIDGHSLGPGIFIFLYFLTAAYATLLILVGAAIVAGIAGQWRWLAGLLVAVLVPMLLSALPNPFLDLNTDFIVRMVGGLGRLIAPAATILAYSITRLIHPVPVVRVRQPAPVT